MLDGPTKKLARMIRDFPPVQLCYGRLRPAKEIVMPDGTKYSLDGTWTETDEGYAFVGKVSQVDKQ